MKDLNQRLLAIFQVEYKEHLEKIRAILGAVERGEGDLSGPALDEAFRRAHSLKGAARAVGLSAVEALSHKLESWFATIRSGAAVFDRSMTGVLHQALDAVEDAVAGRSAEVALRELTGLIEGQPSPSPVLMDSRTESAPAADLALAPSNTLRVSTEHLDRILALTGEFSMEGMRHQAVSDRLRTMVRDFSETERQQGELRRQVGGQLRQLAARPDFSGVTSYLNYVENQLRSIGDVCRALTVKQERNLFGLRQLIGDLQVSAQQARMIPAESIYQGFGKMVRDLARSERKEIAYETRGLDTVADRGVLEALKDPIMHMLRNAVSHGIEAPSIRAQSQKPAAGRVRLSLAAVAGKLIVSIEDDGAGIDHGAIARQAVAKELIADREAELSNPELLERMIFEPGFSTARTVTDLSGRGMGLSVVQSAVEQLQGTIGIKPGALAGTVFTIEAPVAISSLHLLMVSCAGQTFGIPAHAVERVCRANVRSDFQIVEGKRLFKPASGAPVIVLAAALGLEVATETRAHFPVVVVQVGRRRAALIVDEVVADEQAVIQDLGRSSVLGRKVAGAILIEDGSVAVVLNLSGVLDQNSGHSVTPAEWLPEEAEPDQEACILVVDDSMTTRALQKSILESQGYRVTVALDGLEALERLRSTKVDLVITDVEMPRMDGLTLIQEMKKDRETGKIPIIIVSSLERREDQERGLLLGADAYVVKRSFEQEELLETIRQIL